MRNGELRFLSFKKTTKQKLPEFKIMKSHAGEK